MKKYKQFIKQRQGFTMIEVLVALSALSICLLLFCAMCSLMKQCSTQKLHQDDILGIRQIRLLLAQSYDVKLVGNECHFRYRGEEVRLHFHNHRLVKSSGYQIFIKDIEEGYFTNENQCIKLYIDQQEATLYCE